ncbi:hypothetical protein V6N11_024665 [Hibiscus sabdariffa]|uniref:RNase H type-1 domain-containing protein n=1 Tax=Hibiscus sabdariffa TaxID=183260 RepID=A0ABR2QN87_9ROSI
MTSWNVNLIQDVFAPNEAAEILCIPLSSIRLLASIPHVPVRWTALVDPYVKVNYDASFKSNASSYHVASSTAAEAQAAIYGLNFASDLGFQWVEMEGDSRAIVTKLLSASSDTSEMSALIGEAKGLARNFRDCKFFSMAD